MTAPAGRGIGLGPDRLMARRTVWALALVLRVVRVVVARVVRPRATETGQDDYHHRTSGAGGDDAPGQ